MIVRSLCAHAASRQPEMTFGTVSAARDDDEHVDSGRGHFFVRCAITRSVVVPTCPWPSVAVTVYRPGSRSGTQKPESKVPSAFAVVSQTRRPPRVMVIVDEGS